MSIEAFVEAVSAAAARERADKIRQGLEDLQPLVTEAWEQRDWLLLGYDSWHEYVVGEFGGPLRLGREERRETVMELRAAGMSTRAIGAVVGVDHATAARDIGAVANATPIPVTGLDGKTYTKHSTVLPTSSPDEQTTEAPSAWRTLTEVMESIEALLVSDASAIAAAVPSKRRGTTAKRLRKLGTGLGRIAWNLEGSEAINGSDVSD